MAQETEERVAGINTIMTGDIIECLMPSIIEDDLVMIDRTCLVVGIEADRKAEQVRGLVLARFAFTHEGLTPERGLLFLHDNGRREKVFGMRNESVLRHNRVDLIPTDPYYLGEKVTRLGYTRDTDLMQEIGDTFLKNLCEGTQGPRRRLQGTQIRQTAAPDMRPVFPGFPLRMIMERAGALPMDAENDYARAEVQRKLQLNTRASQIHAAFRAATCAEETPCAKETTFTHYVTRADIRRQHGRLDNRAIDQMVSRINADVRRRLAVTAP